MTSKPLKISVVEDNEWYNKILVYTLSLNPDNEVKSFFNGADFVKSLYELPDVVTLDYRLPDFTGLELLRQIKLLDNDIQVVLISEQADINTVVNLLKEGAYDYITKSEDIKDRLLNTIQNIRIGFGLKKEISVLRKEIQKKYDFSRSILGKSQAMKDVYGLIEKAISTNINVTISGETGTGKELVAKAIHYNSKRGGKSFVVVNVAAIPSELIESELFGHEKGSFTGATARRIGCFEEADGGTLFLDEIGEMKMSLQPKLLRALQEKEITRIGSNKPIKTDCRIIVATNKILKDEVKKGTFREDLYYRLLGLPIELPPLRSRENDILILAAHFVDSYCIENEIEVKQLKPPVLKKLMDYSYPGNVRELKSIIDLAVTLAGRGEIEPENLMIDRNDTDSFNNQLEMTMKEYETSIIFSTLKKYNNNIRLTAEKLDIGVSSIYRLLKNEKGT